MKTWIGCTANWTNTNVEDAKWWIIRNEEQEELARLPYSLGEHGVMELVHKIRDLETDSYEAGKEFGGQAMMAAGRQKMKEMALIWLISWNLSLELKKTNDGISRL
jgi:hypothetical protein